MSTTAEGLRMEAGVEADDGTAYKFEIKALLDKPPACQMPIKTGINFKKLLSKEERKGKIIDVSRLQMKEIIRGEEKDIPVQFSGADDFNAKEKPVGTISWIMPENEEPQKERIFILSAIAEDEGNVKASGAYMRAFDENGEAKENRYYPRVEIVPLPNDRVVVEVEGEEIFGYNFSNRYPKPFYFPIVGPAGRYMTRITHPHDPYGHKHHRSMWIEHEEVNGIQFEWVEPGDDAEKQDMEIPESGYIRHQKFQLFEDGPVYGHIVEHLRWERVSGAVILDEVREVTVYPLFNAVESHGDEGACLRHCRKAAPLTEASPVCSSLLGACRDGLSSRRTRGDGTAKELIIDFKIKLSPKARDAHFKKSLYGMLATRVAKHISVLDGGGRIQNSEGGINEKEIHSNRAKWCDYSGRITAQEWNGISVFDHPDNPSYPTYWIVRDDGWMCPGVFYGSPKITFKKGEEIVIKHRVYVHKGDAEEGNVAERHNEYISPPKVTIVKF